VDHSKGQNLRNGATTNHAEGYFSQLKRSIDGTHHNRVEVRHLPSYLGEFDWRRSTCKIKDAERFALLGRRLEGRLTYRTLIRAFPAPGSAPARSGSPYAGTGAACGPPRQGREGGV
jgi:hypothetical protein